MSTHPDMLSSSARAADTEYSSQKKIQLRRQTMYFFLMAYRGGYPNDYFLARMLSSLSTTPCGIPRRLGLSSVLFSRMMNRHFPGIQWPEYLSNHGDALDAARADERKELTDLIWLYRSRDHASLLWIAQIIAAGCMGNDHLWRDLGLWSRDDLTELMRCNFPLLASKNNRDMKWKKFLYKQLCIQEGIYTCRAPSCDDCVDYVACFGAED